MKITIDTVNKTIEIIEEVSINELTDWVKSKLDDDYKIVPKVYPYFQYPVITQPWYYTDPPVPITISDNPNP